jgi:hypothetical protein
MQRLATALLVLCLGPALPAAAQSTNTPLTSTKTTADPITLSEPQKQAVIKAALAVNSRQKTPKDFSPTVGATVPKAVYLHGFKPEAVQEAPVLKEYWYAFLDREVVLVDAAEMKVVAVIELPQDLVVNDQPFHGAAEPSSSTNAKDGGASPVGSVPSHTSPESIK